LILQPVVIDQSGCQYFSNYRISPEDLLDAIGYDLYVTPENKEKSLQQIKDLLRQIDIPPRQVLLEAKIYEVDLTDSDLTDLLSPGKK